MRGRVTEATARTAVSHTEGLRRPAEGRHLRRDTAELSVGGLFAGIGAIELGLSAAGLEPSYLCEIDPCAIRVLRARFPWEEGEQLPDGSTRTYKCACQ
jgi:hypothetical protein